MYTIRPTAKLRGILPIFAMIISLVGAFYHVVPALAALAITSISPNIVPNDRSTLITVTGTDFQLGAVVSLDGYSPLTTSFFSNTTLFADIPAGVSTGIYGITVTNPDLNSATLLNSLTVIQQPITPTPTQTPPPAGGYERPVIVIQAYTTSSDSISPGEDFTLFITLYNAGQHYATNVVAIFTAGDLIPRGTGGVVAVGDIAPSNRAEFSQPMTVAWDLWGSIASIDMTVSYTDQGGVLYTERFALAIPIYHPYSPASSPTPTATQSPTPSPTGLMRPQLVITSYDSSINPLQPGSQFSLNITLQNQGNTRARNVTMIVGGGNTTASSTQEPGGISGSGGEFTNFAPIGSSNIQSLGDVLPGQVLEASQELIVNVSTNPGAYPMKISFAYVDERNIAFVDDQVITLLVYRIPAVDISFYQDPGQLYAGQPNFLPIQIVNMGRGSIVLGNLRVNAASSQFMNNVVLVGTLETGGYFTLDATFIPDVAGPVDLIFTVDYTDDFNQYQVISKTITVEVMAMEYSEGEPGTEGFEPLPLEEPETFWQMLWRFILGLLGLDSGIVEPTPESTIPVEGTIDENSPVIVPAPPLKGP